MKLFVKLLVFVFLLDIILGFSLAYIANNIGEPGFIFHVIDEVISFPVSSWNRLFPEYGIYRATTTLFWSVIIFNALVQALVIFGVVKLVKKS